MLVSRGYCKKRHALSGLKRHRRVILHCRSSAVCRESRWLDPGSWQGWPSCRLPFCLFWLPGVPHPWLVAPPSQTEGRVEPLSLWGPSASAAWLRGPGQWITQVLSLFPGQLINRQLHLQLEPLSPHEKIGSRVRTWSRVDWGDTFGSVPPTAAFPSYLGLAGGSSWEPGVKWQLIKS